MKSSILIAAVLAVIVSFGCQQRQEQRGQTVIPPAGAIKTPEEIKQLETIAKAAPSNSNAWKVLGDALMDAQRFGEAVEAYQKALALDPNNVNMRVDYGTCLRGLGQPERAIEEYRRALKINPNHPNAHRNSGVVLAFDLNRKAEAVKEFEKYLEVMPNAPDAIEIRQTIQELKAAK